MRYREAGLPNPCWVGYVPLACLRGISRTRTDRPVDKLR